MAGKIGEALTRSSAKQDVAAQGRKSVNQIMNAMLDGENLRGRFNELLGKRAPQFVSSLVSLVNADATMQKAFFESPMTVIQAGLKAASFDLPVDQNLGYAYIVPFNNYRDGQKKMEATFILGWKGMHQLALRTGAYKTINVVDVREGELLSYNRLTEEIRVEFVEDDEERDKLPVIGYVGYYRLINGTEKTIYMTVQQIEAHEKRFRKGQYQGKGWRESWDDMARKTVYRRLIGKWGVMSVNYQTAAVSEEIADQMRDELSPAPAADFIREPEEAPEPIDGSFDETTGEVADDAE